MTRAEPSSTEDAGTSRSSGRRAVVFIEANPFASRLHVLGPMVEGATASGQDVFVCGPTRAPGTDFSAFEKGLPKGIGYSAVMTSTPVSPGARVTSALLLRLLMAARDLLRPYELRTVVLTAIDDYFGMLPWLSFALRLIFPRTRIIVMRYRVADLMPAEAVLVRQRQKRLLLQLLEKVARPETVIFDERVPGAPRLHVLPDPWTGPFGSISRYAARKHLAWPDEVEIVLLVGGQDERKGFDVAVTALMKLHCERASVRVALVGRVAPQLLPQLHELARSFGDSFIHVTEYISDEDLSVYFAASSVVLLPYHTAFTSTSGVLVRAAASSTPVVASGHGLVGWRTRHHSLGSTFVYPDVAGLCSAIVNTLDSAFDPSRGLQFANACTEEMLSLSVRDLLHE